MLSSVLFGCREFNTILDEQPPSVLNFLGLKTYLFPDSLCVVENACNSNDYFLSLCLCLVLCSPQWSSSSLNKGCLYKLFMSSCGAVEVRNRCSLLSDRGVAQD
uniref:Uncharacterized protein n=1 Tax=Tanacetum cinerariifolium TaxID=118510 RepID=A0A6L2JV17_TANCI|nr:hypothetical protein [Tanacetum cinerariifolium]